MVRTLNLPASFAAEMTRVGGSFPRFVLGIDYAGVLKYYSDIDIATADLAADGKITSWGQLQLQAKAGSVGGHQNISLTIEDSDLVLLDEFTDWPGIQTRACYIFMYYDPAPTGGGWDDRITLFKGVVGPSVKFDEKSATWNITLVDIGKKNNPSIGVPWTRQVFSSMNCSTCQQQAGSSIIPIAYGDPVFGVRGCAIHRPGYGYICQAECSVYPYWTEVEPCRLDPVDLWFTICESRMWQFETGEQCVAVEGVTWWSLGQNIWDAPGYEVICGNLHANGVFEIYDIHNQSHFSWDAGSQRDARGSWAATGRGSYYVTGGVKYLTVPKNAFADWTNGGASYQGALTIWVNCSGGWMPYTSTEWVSVSASHVAFASTGGGPGDYTDPCPNNNYPFIATFGNMGNGTHWLGSKVMAGDPFVYAVNFLPSESVDQLYLGGVTGFIDNNLWTANLNDKTYNVALKRDPSDDGITTVTFHGWFQHTWWMGQMIYGEGTLDSISANLKGIMGHPDHRAYDGTALSNPVDIIEDYLTNPFLGNTPYSMIDTAAFDEAKDRLEALTDDIAPSNDPQGLRFAFAQYEPEELNKYIQELAFHGTMLFFWDMGLATLSVIFAVWEQDDTVFELNESNQSDDTFGFELIDIEESPTELVGVFSQWTRVYGTGTSNMGQYRGVQSATQNIIRRSSEAELHRPRKSEELKLWMYQEVYSVNYVLETWLRDRVNTSARVNASAHLDAMLLQPGDIIDIQRQSGVPKVLLHKMARIESASQSIGDPRSDKSGEIKFKAVVRLTDFAIEPAAIRKQDCDDTVPSPLDTTPPPGFIVAGAATTTVLPTTTTLTTPPVTTLPATTTTAPIPPTTSTTTTTTPPTCTASGDCAWQYDPTQASGGNP